MTLGPARGRLTERTLTESDRRTPDAGYRADVEGLRAVAILLVVAYHAGIAFLPGGFVGVDVFFVISGYLITGLLARELSATGRISIPRFYARRVRRLLPAIVVMTVTIAVLSWLVLDPLRREDTGGDIDAAGLFYANWHFAQQAVDYLASQQDPSPMLHMWSLSVEEQFYLAWPLLLLVLTAIGTALARVARNPSAFHRRWIDVGGLHRRLFDDGRSESGQTGHSIDQTPVNPARIDQTPVNRAVLGWVLLAGVGVVVAVSLLLSWWQTPRDPGLAYFSSFTRAWELALGGALALLTPQLRALPRVAAALLGWAGLLAIVVAGVVITADMPFPGTVALLPTVGAGALLAAGVALPGSGASRLLSAGPMRQMGEASYGWYLWHWPLLVLAAAWLGHDLTVLEGIVVVAVAYGLAVLSLRLVENPVRHSASLRRHPGRTLLVGLACTCVVVATGLVLRYGTPPRVLPPGEALGAAALHPTGAPGHGSAGIAPVAPPPAQTSASAVSPDPSVARDDLPILYSDGCHRSYSSTSASGCVFGDPSGTVSVFLFGDSHAAQWFPALEVLATKYHWRLTAMTKSGCPAPNMEPYNSVLKRGYSECPTWRANVMARIAQERPQLVFTDSINGYSLAQNGQAANGAVAAQAQTNGWLSTLRALSRSAGSVVLLRDTPDMGRDVAGCVSAHMSNLLACSTPRSIAIAANQSDQLAQEALGALPHLHYLDMNDYVCPGTRCPAVIGNVLVYRDKDHLTATYMRTLAPVLYTRLLPDLP
ncbi:MAG TPA: acyltransferase family protein [Candidatus Nanopelagicales bacterium]